MTGPNFYTIDFSREVVLQGKSTTFITIGRDESNLLATEDLYVIVMPNTRTFNSYLSGVQTPGGVGLPATQEVQVATSTSNVSPGVLSFNNIEPGMTVKNAWDFQNSGGTGPTSITVGSTIDSQTNEKIISLTGDPGTLSNNGPTNIHIGEWDDSGKNRWKINGKILSDYEYIAYTTPPSNQDVINLPNIFDGSQETFVGPSNTLIGTGYVGRQNGGWVKVISNPKLPNASVTLRIDYDGTDHSHMKFNLIIFKRSNTSGGLLTYQAPLNLPTSISPNSEDYVKVPFGVKSGSSTLGLTNYLDYQEVHFFGYKDTDVRTSRTTYQNDYQSETKIYDDRTSYSLLKTNPKISGNVKITLDSTGNLWLNSIDANNELADSAYKKYPVSPLSTYPRDLYKFFKNGQTPTSIIFDLYQVDNLYQNTKRNLYEQFDNFYNYGVEQLKSKYYDENFSFFAPLWLRKNVPDFFVVFRLDHPVSEETYKNASNPEVFKSFFKDARIVKTFDMREKSQLGTYLRKITTDPRFKERPLDVSFDNDIPTVWNGISYADGTMTGKGEFLYDYWRQDRPVIELEEYITGGYQRNGIISSNLVNLEFLFDDEEATPYSINRYFGLYVTENQLANFQIDSIALGKITGQTPLPKVGVDGEPYSTKEFIQNNPNGIEIPVRYFHNPTGVVNNTNIPSYQGDVVGKFPLPSFVEDPLRIFYVKDREDVFKRITALSEVDYGNPGTDEYRRVTQVKLFDNTEDMSKYAGVNQISSQFNASLLNKGAAQLRLHLAQHDSANVFADDEVIELTVNQYNSDPRNHQYYLKVKSSSATDITFYVFKDQQTEDLSAATVILTPGYQIPVIVNDASKFIIGQQVYVTDMGYFTVETIDVLTNTIALSSVNTNQSEAVNIFGAGVPSVSFSNVITNSSTLPGLPVTVDVETDFLGNYSIKIVDSNLNYSLNNTFTINGTSLGGSSPLNDVQFELKEMGGPDLISVGGPTYISTYNYTPFSNDLTIDPILSIVLTNPLNFAGDESYDVEIKDTQVSFRQLGGTPSPVISAKASPISQQFKWRMTASPVALAAGQSWNYPVADPNGYDYTTNFSNEGTPSQVATALASAINSFENRPCDALAINDVVYLKAVRAGLEGDNIQLTRLMIDGQSNVFNMGFYERSNVNLTYDVSVVNLPGSATAPVYLKNRSSIAGHSYTFVEVYKTISGIYFQLREGVTPTSLLDASLSGTVSYEVAAASTKEYTNPDLNFAIDISGLSLNVYHQFVVESNVGPLSIKQLFIGGSERNRNRASIGFVDSERYFSDRRINLTANIITGSNVLSNVLVDNIYVGAPVTGDGIPANTYVNEIDYLNNQLIISNAATLGTPSIPATLTTPFIPAKPYTSNITVGELSILNNQTIKDQWYQAQKGFYSQMKPWEIQGKYVYSLPYLEETVYDRFNNVSDYTNLGEYSIIQLDNNTNEFYQTTDKRIVAYDIYRPIVGIFSIFPIKEFDVDFYFSDYSYTPILEALRYYFNETVNKDSSIVLPSDENYKITPIDTAGNEIYSAVTIKIEALNPDTNTWDAIEEIGLNTESLPRTSKIKSYVINTYYPFYVYDELEQPQVPSDPSNYYVGGSGLRNFMRRSISSTDDSGIVTEKVPHSYRLSFSSSNINFAGVNIVKNDYYADNDLKTFQGFSALGDIYSPEDADAVRGLLNDEKYVEAFLYQALRSEYDRLRENFNKDYALRSRVVPYISKWVQEGTDARDNYYRLDNSKAFGITNFSPDTNVKFAEPSLLTNEFPYLDTVPKDYPIESLEGSRSYMFAKLGDAAKGTQTWLDLLTTNDDDDWFTKYFSVGYPTEINPDNGLVPKSRDERFTFMIYNEGIKRSQTLFRGGKIQVLDINDQLIPPTEITDSTKYNDYKFATIARIVPYDPYFVEKIDPKQQLVGSFNNGKTQKPVDIEVYRNDKFKSITMIITVRVQDYRVQSGLSDYLFLYAVNDQLKNYNQMQVPLGNRSVLGYSTSLSITDFMPYQVSNPVNLTGNLASYTDFAAMRARQGFFGGGYLELGDTRLGGLVHENNGIIATNPKWNPSTGNLILKYKSVDPNYDFSVLNEIIPTLDNYTNKDNVFSSPVVLNITPTSFTKAGSIFKLINAGLGTSNRIVHIDRSNSRLVNDQYLPDQTTFGSTGKPLYSAIVPGTVTSINELSIKPFTPGPNYSSSPLCELDTFNIKGGTDAYVHIKNLLTYASIQEFINSDSEFIEYYKVEGNTKTSVSDFKLRFINPDQIVKTGVLAYVNDEDKPIEYLGSPIIGYDIVNTNQNEVVYRHRGSYEPKSNDILSFWVREDKAFTEHYEKDYLLFNTHFNDQSPLSGLLRNYGINKVADAEVLKIQSGGAYKSVYPLVGEVSVDAAEIFVLNSTWDKHYYRRYNSTTDWAAIDGYEEMKEFKSFLGSKTMNIPKTQILETYKETEATYSVLEPAEVVGVKLLSKKAVSLTDVQGNTKPILTIDLNIKERLLRKLYEDIDLPTSFDEFSWLTTLGVTELQSLTATDIERLKKEYLLKNILELYTISEIKLYALSKEGLPLFDITIDDRAKIAAGYRVDKDCKVTNVDEWHIRITKQLDTKKPYGYAVSATIKRI